MWVITLHTVLRGPLEGSQKMRGPSKFVDEAAWHCEVVQFGGLCFTVKCCS